MQVARFRTSDAITFGIVDKDPDSGVTELVELVADPMVAGYETTGRRFPLAEVTLLSPVIPRSKVVGVGKNYADHREEMRELSGGDAPADKPVLFLKPNTSVIGPNDPIVLPEQSERVEFEGELAVVIGAVAKAVPTPRALEVVYGFTCANDVTARDLQIADKQWTRAKSFDTFCPIGPVIETDLDLAAATLTTAVNGEERQRAAVSDMLHGVAELVSYASAAFTLLPGDVILTGTPAGVGVLTAGDRVTVAISGIGELSNPVVAAPAAR